MSSVANSLHSPGYGQGGMDDRVVMGKGASPSNPVACGLGSGAPAASFEQEVVDVTSSPVQPAPVQPVGSPVQPARPSAGSSWTTCSAPCCCKSHYSGVRPQMVSKVAAANQQHKKAMSGQLLWEAKCTLQVNGKKLMKRNLSEVEAAATYDQHVWDYYSGPPRSTDPR